MSQATGEFLRMARALEALISCGANSSTSIAVSLAKLIALVLSDSEQRQRAASMRSVVCC